MRCVYHWYALQGLKKFQLTKKAPFWRLPTLHPFARPFQPLFPHVSMEQPKPLFLLGRVCQLNYLCGGTLEQRQPPKRLRFSTAHPLRIGQEVLFRTQQRPCGEVVAIDICLPEGPPNEVRVDPKSDGRWQSHLPVSSGDGLTVDVPESQVRQLLHRRTVFENAGEKEQIRLVMEAENLLKSLLSEPKLNGDAICRLVRKCVSWLHPPVFPNSAEKKPHDASLEGNTECQMQKRVRRILIDALSHLDLEDRSTFQAVTAAMFYLASLIQRSNGKKNLCDFAAATASQRQWLKLRQLLVDGGLKHLFSDSTKATFLDEQVLNQARKRIWQSQAGKKAGKFYGFAGNEDFEPPASIKALSTTFHDKEVALRCSNCTFTVTSSWHFQSPKSLKRSVIGPPTGHGICQRKLKKNCVWKSVDGSPVTRARIVDLKYCRHKKILRRCKNCKGKQGSWKASVSVS